MGFADQIKAFTGKVNDALDAKKLDTESDAKKILLETLGEDASLIESISLDADVGKFYDVVAPEHVVAKLRAANLLRT